MMEVPVMKNQPSPGPGPAAQPLPVSEPAPVAHTDPMPDISGLPFTGMPGPAEQSFAAARDSEPDTAAKVLRATRQTGLSPEYVAQNLPQVDKVLNAPSGETLRVIDRHYPGTARWLADPQNMAISHDDLPNLTQTEGLYDSLKHGLLMKSVADAMIQKEMGDFGNMEMNGVKLNQAQQDRLEDIQRLMAENQNPNEGWAAWAVRNVVTGGIQSLQAVMASGEAAAQGAIGGGLAAAVTPGAQPLIPAMAASGALVGGAYGVYDYSRKQEAGLAYYDFLKVKDEAGHSLNPQLAAAAAQAVGVVNGLVETAGTGFLLRAFPGGHKLEGMFTRSALKDILAKKSVRTALFNALKTAGETAISEGSQEAVQEISNILAGEMAKKFDTGGNFKPDSAWNDLKRVGGAFGGGAVTGLGLGSVGQGLEFTKEVAQAKKAEAVRQAYLDIGKSVEASKVRQRDPETFMKLQAAHLKDGPLENVYIPVGDAVKYFQTKGVDAGEVFQEMGVIESFNEAIQRGPETVVRIPLPVWQDKVVGTEAYEGLADDIKFHPDDLTKREADRIVEDTKAKTQAEADKAGSTQTVELVSMADSAMKIKDEMVSQLTRNSVGGKKITKADAAPQAELMASFFSTLAAKYPAGTVDPYDLFKSYRLRVMGEGKTDGVLTDEDMAMIRAEAERSELFAAVVENGGVTPLLDFIRANGKLDWEKTKAAGWKGEMTDLNWTQIFAKQGGHAPDRMAEMAAEGGNGPIPVNDTIQMMEQIDKESRAMAQFDYDHGKGSRDAVNRKVRPPKKLNQTKPDYGGEHRPPGPDSGAPLHDVTGGGDYYPDDIYGPNGTQYYGTGEAHLDHLTMALINRYRNRPDATVAIYRAVPRALTVNRKLAKLERQMAKYMARGVVPEGEVKDGWYDRAHAERDKLLAAPPEPKQKKPTINPGDWVTINRRYAKEHGQSALKGEYQIISKYVKAKEIFTNGDSIHEFGYFPEGEKAVAKQTDSPAFKNWFSESKVVDESGNPKVVYHGTDKKFSSFKVSKSTQGIFWFTSSKDKIDAGDVGAQGKGQVMELFASIKKPAGWDEYDKFGLDELKAQGFDGAILPDKDGQITGFVFDSKQFKSATKNIGTFNPADPNIYHQTRQGGDAPLPEQKFHDSYLRHIDLSKNPENQASIAKDGFKRGFGPNALPSAPDDTIMGKKYSVSKGDVVYFVPESETIDTPNGRRIKEGWKPRKHEVATATEDGQSSYSLYLSTFPKDTLFQGDGDPMGEMSKGEFGIDIKLFRTADQSTFLHEMGHFFLTVLEEQGMAEGAPAEVKALHDDVVLWLGNFPGEELTTEQHEKFARTFEAYLREGKAPTKALRLAFAKFKDWLTKIYRSIRGLDTEISPQITALMDRLVATQDEIARAQFDSGMVPNDIKGLDPKVAAKLKDYQDRARHAAEETLLKEQMGELKADHKEFLAKEKARLEAESETKVSEMPLFSAMTELGTQAKQAAKRFLDGKAKDSDRAKMEESAALHGFGSGEELAKAVVSSDKTAEIDRLVAEGMAPYADLKDSQKIRQAAVEAIHNDRGTELLALESEIFDGLVHKAEIGAEATRRNRSEATVAAQAARQQAVSILAGKSVKDASNARTYVTAERNAAVRAAKALASKDFEKAAEAKRQQMLNHALATAAIANKKVSDKALRFLTREARKPDMAGMPYGFNRQREALLVRFGLKAAEPEATEVLTQIAKKMADSGENAGEIANATGMVQAFGSWRGEKLAEFVERINDDYYGLTIPSSIMATDGKMADELTMATLLDLKDSVKAIAGIGRAYKGFLSEFVKADLVAAAREFRKSVEKNVGKPYAADLQGGHQYSSAFKENVAGIGKLPDAAIPSMVNMETLCNFLDHGPDGPAHEYIYRIMKRSEDREMERKESMKKAVNGIFAKFYDENELAEYESTRRYYTELGAYLTDHERLMLIMNWGNEGNRNRITTGFGWTEEQVMSVINQAEKRDWDVAQEVGKHLETYWPDIVALEMRIRGSEPTQVKVSPVETVHGRYDGWYFPIAYDYEKSSEAMKTEIQKNELYKQYSSAAAHTERGFAEARQKNVNRKVRLNISVLTEHLDNVIHDLEFRAGVIDVSRFLRQPDVRVALENSVGVKGTTAIDKWLQRAASDQGEYLDGTEKAVRWFRFKMTFSALGVRLITMPADITGNVILAMKQMGPGGTIQMMTNFAFHPGEISEFVEKNSVRMRNRALVRDSSLFDVSKRWFGKESVLARYNFATQALADEMVSKPMWHRVYSQEVQEHGHDKAVDLADEAVTRTFGSGSSIDKAGVQFGSEYKKSLWMFYSWNSMMFNQAWLQGKFAGLERTKGNTGQAVWIMAKAGTILWLAQGVQEAIWREFFRNRQTDDEDARKKRMAVRVASQGFGYLGFWGGLASYGINLAAGTYNAHYSASALEDAAENVIKAAWNTGKASVKTVMTFENQFDSKVAEEAFRSILTTSGLPQQIDAWVFNYLDWLAERGEFTWRDLVTRRTKT